MFHDWENFYIILGPTAGALIGIMFVVATLTAEMDDTRRTRGAQIYITPVVFHLAVIVVVSAISAVPDLTQGQIGGLLAICSFAGLFYATRTMIRVFTVAIPGAHIDLSDKCFYGILPIVTHLGLAGATAAVWLAPPHAPYALAAVMVALLLLAIRNAWDLATFLVHPQG